MFQGMRLGSPPAAALLILCLCARASAVVAQDGASAPSGDLDLSPRAAARAGALSDAMPRPGAARELSERDLSEGIPGLVRLRDATVGQAAAYHFNRVVWRILQFWKRPPDSRRVRYVYVGRSVDVAIHDDGSYEIRDKRGLSLGIAATRSMSEPSSGATRQVDEESTRNPEGAPARPVGVAIGFREPGRMLQSILTGTEPANAEVRAFLEATRPLRDHLLDREALRAQAAASVRMNEQLRKIWQVPGPSERKRQDTFALWDHCSEDETGALARGHIEAFVRDLAVRRGACPFAAVELARLNQVRRSKAPFSPCDAAEVRGAGSQAADVERRLQLDAQVPEDAGVDRR